MCYAISEMWPEAMPSDPHIIRSLVLWTGTLIIRFRPAVLAEGLRKS